MANEYLDEARAIADQFGFRYLPGFPLTESRAVAAIAQALERRALAGGGWNTDLAAMPTEGRFEALRAYHEVFRNTPKEQVVIEPTYGRMFVPLAWRPVDADG